MKTIGVIGGLGPMATVYYLELLTNMANVKKDQCHPRVYMVSIPDIPDRTAYILGESQENPIPLMIQAGKDLQKMGADFVTIPCVTAGYFYTQLEEALEIPVVNLLQEIAHALAREHVQKVGILATSGTNRSGVLTHMIRSRGIEVVLPNAHYQQKLMELIYQQIKAGREIDWDSFADIAQSLLEQGVDKILLGCTELPLLRKLQYQCQKQACVELLQQTCVDALEILAQCALRYCDIPIRIR